LNPRPLEPHSSALPSCATARSRDDYSSTAAESPEIYGDFKNVHCCGVLAAKSRAAQLKDYEIEKAAAQLITLIGMTTDAHARR
jgi:hypothetical protein